MLGSSTRRRVVLISVAILMVSGFAFSGLAGALVVTHAPSAAPSGNAKTVVSAPPAAASTPSVGTHLEAAKQAVSSDNLGAEMARSALAATQAAGLKSNVVFVPRPSATPAEVSAAQASGVVTPLYNGSPAPMGLAYFGLSAGPGGKVVGTVLNTTSLRASVDANATGIQAADLFLTDPDSYGIQLNAVVTNVTLFGTPGYSFWTQNVVEYYPATHFLILVTNVWNFTAAALSPNVFYQHGPYGVQVGTEYYYAEYIVPEPIYYPFNLTLYENSTVTSGRNTVDFTVQLGSDAYPSENFTTTPQGPGVNYDYVIFNSIAPGGSPITTPSPYTANGFSYNPIGLTDDFELIFGGPGGGSQSTLFDADATLGLAYWNGAGYVSVPAAYNYGGETGETVTGTSIAWSDAPGGPYGLSTYATMTTGPAILSGLWNASGPEGSVALTLGTAPANAFNILTPVVGPGAFSANFTIAEPAIAPELYTNTLYLTPGKYTLLTELTGYAPVTTSLDVGVSAPGVLNLHLTPDPTLGIYTPLWAFSNAEIGALAISGQGTSAYPYLMPNVQPAPLSSVFGLYNDYVFPVYPAVFFYHTTAVTEFVNPPSFSTVTNTFSPPGQFLPPDNDLQYWFSNTSYVGIMDASNISGWFGATTFYPSVFNTFSVIFYEGGHNLIANNTFDSMGQGLLIFGGGNLFAPPFNVGGTNNTIWGNTFNEVLSPPVAPNAPKFISMLSPVFGLGVELAAPQNTVYNNAFLTPTTAWVLPINIYSGYPFFYANTFNITPAPGSVTHIVPWFPAFQMSGSILGANGFVNGNASEQGWQGGNFWWDYGSAFNPYNGANNRYGVLPYDENASTLLVDVYGPAFYYATYIYPGGDFAPLVPSVLYPVTVHEAGLPTGSNWTIMVYNAGGAYANVSTNGTSIDLSLPSGSYGIMNAAPGGYGAGGPEANNFTVANAAVTVTLQFAVIDVSFTETGLPASALARGWTVEFGGVVHTVTTVTVVIAGVADGVYAYLISGPFTGFTFSGPHNYRVSVGAPDGTVAVASASIALSVGFAIGPTVHVAFSEHGLPAGTAWCVVLSGWQVCPTKSSVKYVDLTVGEYPYAILPIAGEIITASTSGKAFALNGTLNLSTNTTVRLTYVHPYAVTFNETGLAHGAWSITLKGVTETAPVGVPIVFNVGNGTYAYKVGPEPGYTHVGVPSSRVTVDGGPASVAITFTAKP